MNRSLIKYTKWCLLVMVIAFANGVSAQYSFPDDTIPNPNDYSRYGYEKAIAYYQIESLRDGVLLVRLQTNQKSIDRFNEIGNEAAAKKIQDRQKDYNDGIISAFKESFDFCDVYFFTSNYSDTVRAHKLTEIPFVDKHIVSNKPVDLASATFLVAEFTTLTPDTATVRVNAYDYEGERKKGASVNTNMGISALVFKNDQIEQLSTPFPYYVRLYKDFIKALIGVDWSIRKLSKVVEKANNDLKIFAVNKDWRIIEKRDELNPPVDTEYIQTTE